MWRLREFSLLLVSITVTVTGFILLALAQGHAPGWSDLAPALVFVGAVLVAQAALSLRHEPEEPFLFPVAATLTGLGLVLAYRLAPALAVRQLAWIVLGLMVMVIAARTPQVLRALRRYPYTWAFLGLGLLALTLIFGRRADGSGSRLWLGMGSFAFQPSELLKVLLVVFLASYLERTRDQLARGRLRLGPLRLPPLAHLGPLLVMCGLSLLLLAWQRDLGAALLFYGIFLAMLYAASNRLSYTWGGGLLFLAGAMMVVTAFAHVRARFDIWLNPWPGAREESFQIIQGLIALASGGLAGQGLGLGFPTYIPAVHTDFVFAAIGEEMGLAGLLAVIGCYVFLSYRGYRLALLNRDPFRQLLATGLTTIFALQALVIMAGNLRLIPLTGVTLPFLSYGGSSLVTSYLMLGLLQSISSPQYLPGLQSPNPQSPTRRLARLFLSGFALVSLVAAYWGFVRGPELVARADNPRHVELERRIARGRLLDRHGTILAETTFEKGTARRRYPYPALAPVLGYYSLRYGVGGVEAAVNDDLRGVTGLDPWTAFTNALYHRSQVGHDVRLTIDLDVQRVADEALGDQAGAVVVIEAHSGAIVALASHPTYDPNTLDQAFDRLQTDPARPLLNRATQGRYPPGSTFKTVTLAAALQENLAYPGEQFDDGEETLYVEGFPIRCNNNPKGINSFDLAHAYGWSCNLTFARLGLALGTKRYKDYAARFMLGEEIPFELPVARSQLANNPLLMDQVLLANTAFGQGELLVTPLHMALIAATVANDGVMPRPYLVAEVRDAEGRVLRQTQPAISGLSIPVTPETARLVLQMMVVAAEDGYAQRGRVPGVVTGGKTGTAQLGGETAKPHAWFIGVAPADESSGPRYAVAVLVEHGGEGSRVAAPIGRRVLEAALRR